MSLVSSKVSALHGKKFQPQASRLSLNSQLACVWKMVKNLIFLLFFFYQHSFECCVESQISGAFVIHYQSSRYQNNQRSNVEQHCLRFDINKNKQKQVWLTANPFTILNVLLSVFQWKCQNIFSCHFACNTLILWTAESAKTCNHLTYAPAPIHRWIISVIPIVRGVAVYQGSLNIGLPIEP